MSTITSRAAEVLDALVRHRDLTDGQIATIAGRSRQWVQQKRTGIARISFDDLELLCPILNVEPVVFLMEPSEAIRWCLDHAPTLRGRPSGCSNEYPADLLRLFDPDLALVAA